MGLVTTLFGLALWANAVLAAITTSESSSTINISNGRLSIVVSKSAGTVSGITLDGQDLLGSGGRLYLDCHCDGGYWSSGTGTLYKGTDSTGTAWAGVKLGSNFADKHVMETYFFLRDGETGLHSFGRAAYPNGGALGEMRFLFRPTSTIWNQLSSSNDMWSVIPTGTRETVQDTTYYVPGSGVNEVYRKQMSDYFSKYMFSESWENHTHHGMFADGTGTRDGSVYGAWLIMNTRDTFYNGPKWSDLTVDGIVYNYVGMSDFFFYTIFTSNTNSPVSNHHGNGNPDLTGGFDRTFGPVGSVFLFDRAEVLTPDGSPITISTKLPREPQFRACVPMPGSSRIQHGTRNFMIPLLNTSRVMSRPLAAVRGKAKSNSRRVSPKQSPSSPATGSTSKTTTSTQSHTSTGATSAPAGPSRCPASRPERTA